VAAVLRWRAVRIVSGSLTKRREECSSCIAQPPIWGDRRVSLPYWDARSHCGRLPSTPRPWEFDAYGGDTTVTKRSTGMQRACGSRSALAAGGATALGMFAKSLSDTTTRPAA
jgi:hypothetical protein